MSFVWCCLFNDVDGQIRYGQFPAETSFPMLLESQRGKKLINSVATNNTHIICSPSPCINLLAPPGSFQMAVGCGSWH